MQKYKITKKRLNKENFLNSFTHNTKIAYKNVIENWEWGGSHPPDIYIQKEREKGRTWSTVKKNISIIISYKRYLKKTDLETWINALKMLKNRHSPPVRETKYLSLEIQKKIFKYKPKTEKEFRDFTIFTTILGAGLRRSEIAKLKISDVTFNEEGQAFLYLRNTKNGDDVIQPVALQSSKILKNYINQNFKDFKERPLFYTYTGRGGNTKNTLKTISHSAIRSLVVNISKLFGFPISTHSLRATAITKLLNEGVTIRDVAAFSRHKCISSLSCYDKDKKEAARRTAKKLYF